MTVTTEETFKVDGVILNTFAWNIDTLSGREGLPPRRGKNIPIPFRTGRVWTPKTYEERTINLSMWVKGSTEDGVIPAEGARAKYNDNLRVLKRLFAPTQRQVSLERKLRFTTGLETHTALAELANLMEPLNMGSRMANLNVDLRMADPWWYGVTQSTDVLAAGATINNPGDVEATSMFITFVGPLTNPRLRNNSISPTIDVRYLGTIAAGQTVVLDTTLFSAIDQGGSSVVGAVSHVGSLLWMMLIPGNNTMTLDNYTGGSVGSGKATVAFKPPYT